MNVLAACRSIGSFIVRRPITSCLIGAAVSLAALKIIQQVVPRVGGHLPHNQPHVQEDAEGDNSEEPGHQIAAIPLPPPPPFDPLNHPPNYLAPNRQLMKILGLDAWIREKPAEHRTTASYLIIDALTNHKTELTLSNLDLTDLPDCIAQLTKLEKLDISRNMITRLPNTIANLTNIRELDASRNLLKNGYRFYHRYPFPKLDQLVNLTIIRLGANEITQLPDPSHFPPGCNIYCGLNRIEKPEKLINDYAGSGRLLELAIPRNA